MKGTFLYHARCHHGSLFWYHSAFFMVLKSNQMNNALVRRQWSIVMRGVLVLKNFSEAQILWSLCLVVFLAFTLRLLIQTSLSVAPEIPVSLPSGEKMSKFQENKHTPDRNHLCSGMTVRLHPRLNEDSCFELKCSLLTYMPKLMMLT